MYQQTYSRCLTRSLSSSLHGIRCLLLSSNCCCRWHVMPCISAFYRKSPAQTAQAISCKILLVNSLCCMVLGSSVVLDEGIQKQSPILMLKLIARWSLSCRASAKVRSHDGILFLKDDRKHIRRRSRNQQENGCRLIDNQQFQEGLPCRPVPCCRCCCSHNYNMNRLLPDGDTIPEETCCLRL